MEINSKYLDKITRFALSDFFSNELSSILTDVAERNLCARLAMHFEHHMRRTGLKGYYADPEYNRKQNGLVKTILSGTTEVIQITCDLIIHSRGEILGKDNLIALEMAKSNKSVDDMNADRKRLMTLTKSSFDGIWSYDGKTHPKHVCGYINGIFLIIDHQTRTALLEFYSAGLLSRPIKKIIF